MNFIRKLEIFGIVTFLAGLSWAPALTIVQTRANKLIKPYVEKNLAEIVRSQEEKLGIKHFRLPMVKFENQGIFENSLLLGSYNSGEDTIYLNPIFSVTPELNATNLLLKFLSFGVVFNVKEILDHELGHFYIDKKYESMGTSNWYKLDGYINLEKIISIKIISEGISEYFEREINGKKDSPDDFKLPENLLDFAYNETLVYNAGYNLVKPVIDKYGERGIEVLIKNLPNAGELISPQKYQERIFKELSTESKE